MSRTETTIAASEHGDALSEVTLRSLGEIARDLAARIDTIWMRHPTDGVMALRLVEASHSLHRAAIALQDDVVIGRRR